MEKSGQLHVPATLTPGENPRTLWIRGWVVLQPVWIFQRREKSDGPIGVQNPCSIVTIAHSFTQTTQWTDTSDQHTLQSSVCIMYCNSLLLCQQSYVVHGAFFYWICLSCGLYLKLLVSSADTCTKQHIISVITFTYQKGDKGTSQQVTGFVKWT